ncbi:MAG: hypothetical protein WCX61_02980, partial [Candidatus Peribacteraceae bacterium]
MNTTFSSSKSQKPSSGATPFDQITHLENQENERVKQELDAMTREKVEVEKAVAEKQVQAEEEMKNQARVELKEYSEKELSPVLAKAQKNEQKRSTTLEEEYAKKSPDVIKKLVTMMSESDSSL